MRRLTLGGAPYRNSAKSVKKHGRHWPLYEILLCWITLKPFKWACWNLKHIKTDQWGWLLPIFDPIGKTRWPPAAILKKKFFLLVFALKSILGNFGQKKNFSYKKIFPAKKLEKFSDKKFCVLEILKWYSGKTVQWITLKFCMMKVPIKKNISWKFRKNRKNKMAVAASLKKKIWRFWLFWLFFHFRPF